jgi:hypothetical protein
MSPRRLISILSVCVVASASVVAAQPKKDAKKGGKAPLAPAKGSAAGSATGSASAAAGSGSAGGSGEAVQMTEDAPPSDMNGTDENPDAPRDIVGEDKPVVVAPKLTHAPGYPIEEALRPITLPQNMSEVALDPHFQVSPFDSTVALRARYGITRQAQLGLTYVIGGVYDDPSKPGKQYGFHAGKAVGLDVTVLLQNWIGVHVGVPIYIDPLAVSLALGAPMKFTFGDKFALGGLDDLLNIKITKFAPSFYQEVQNAVGAANEVNHTQQSRGRLRFSAYGVYQYMPKTAMIGRFGVDNDLGTSGGGPAGTSGATGTTTFIRAGIQHTPRKYLDVGVSAGFDDLAHLGSFGLAFLLALRI